MRISPWLVAAAAGLPLVGFLACSSDDTCTSNDCTSAASGSDSGPNGDGSNVDGNVPVPEGCDPAAEPKDAPKCVVNEFGVFVDGATGNDSGAGTKEAPFKTIGAALGKLAGRQRIYVCEGTYAEKVKVTSAVSIYGGWACGGWSYSGNKAKIAPNEVGFALEVSKVSSRTSFVDLAVASANGTAERTSSVAVFLNASARVSLTRVSVTAGTGFKGSDGTVGAVGTLVSSTPSAGTLNGNSGNAGVGGAAQTCICAAGTSKGGKGGDVNANGLDGETAQASPDPATATGQGGLKNDCENGAGMFVNGRPGSNAPNRTSAGGATTTGILSETGWSPGNGTPGDPGAPGQGGGGGGGFGGGGGGGACGGCGGAGGGAGGGGGASIGVAVFQSVVAMSQCSVTAHQAGNAGNGAIGGNGQLGGTKGNGNGNACTGGPGGRGGNGGAGGGGAGGSSAGIVYRGPAPTLAETTIATGSAGAKGLGGAPGLNDGIDGQKVDVLALP